MQLSEQQLLTLEQLGIPVWQLRQHSTPDIATETSLNAAIPTAETFNSDAALLIYCPLAANSAEQQLLTNILKAIAGRGLTCQQCDSAELAALPADGLNPPHILIFGKALPELNSAFQTRSQLLPSLADLLAEPARKADVWSAICQLSQKAH